MNTSPTTRAGSQYNGKKDYSTQPGKWKQEEGDTQCESWWEESNNNDDDGTVKWTTLEHNGVLFSPAYKPLPAHVKMVYDGVPVMLEPKAEEVACFFGKMLNASQYVKDSTFRKSFFRDFQNAIKKTSGATDLQRRGVGIESFEKCDFTSIFEYFQTRHAEQKSMTPAEKKEQKAIREATEYPYRHCLWDGKRQKVGNFRIEPPGLFLGRGDHPRNGMVKTRVLPEQVTINIGKEADVPSPPSGHHWKEVRHDRKATWLAMWKENVNGNHKYVMLAAGSDVRGQSDYRKFETARRLKHHIDHIRRDYQKGLRHELMATRQLATAVYLIDRLALRAVNEKGEGEAETVGCCSLKYENVTLRPPNTLILDFLGKDSIRFYDEVEVDRQVFKNFKIFRKHPKIRGDEIFDRLTV